MKSLATIKSEESAKLAADYADWLHSGGKTVLLPGPGDGHRLEGHFTLRQNIDQNIPKKPKAKYLRDLEKGKFKGAK